MYWQSAMRKLLPLSAAMKYVDSFTGPNAAPLVCVRAIDAAGRAQVGEPPRDSANFTGTTPRFA
jgi:hypothetical protein